MCGRRARGYDRGEGARRWRALDLGTTKAYVEAEAPRVDCRRHGVVVARAAWARHGSRFTRAFEQQVAWLATQCSKTAVCELMRISWPTVGRIIERVVADERLRRGDPLEGLRRIGIDELSFRKGQRYITVVVDHDTGRLVWASEGRDKKTVLGFFDQLGRRARRPDRARLQRSGRVDHPGGAGALPGRDALPRPLPRRRARHRGARRGAPRGLAAGPPRRRHERRPLAQRRPLGALERPERLTERQQAKLATIEHVNRRLYRAYLLKEELRLVFHTSPDEAVPLLEAWLVWARRCRIASFVKLAKTITTNKAGITATLTHRLSNARIEAINTTLRLICRRAYGFHSAEALIALAMLTVGGLRPPLPGRTRHPRKRQELPSPAHGWSRSPLVTTRSRLQPAGGRAAPCSRSETPARCHSSSRRQQITPEPKPSSSGRCRHAIPVCKTTRPLQRFPIGQPLAPRIAEPPLGLRKQRLDPRPQLVRQNPRR